MSVTESNQKISEAKVSSLPTMSDSSTLEALQSLHKALNLLENISATDSNVLAKKKLQEAIELLQGGPSQPQNLEYHSVAVQTIESTLNLLYINDLPNECLALIFKLIPLQDLLPLRLICHRWCEAIEGYCATLHHLKLFQGLVDAKVYSKKIYQYHLDLPLHSAHDLYIKHRHFGPELLNFLVTMFPAVKQLTYSQLLGPPNSAQDSAYLVTLLKHWPNLTNLVVHGQLNLDGSVMNELAKQSSLCRLHLMTKSATANLPTALVGQLEHLSLGDRYTPAFLASLTNLPPTCTLHLIRDRREPLRLQVDSPLREHPYLANVVHLSLDSIDHDARFVAICTKMVNLRYLKFTPRFHLNFLFLHRHITSLRHLEHLDVQPIEITLNAVALRLYGERLQHSPVKRLFLASTRHNDFRLFDGKSWCSTLQMFFPFLEELHLITWGNRLLRQSIREHLKTTFPMLKYGNIM